MTSLEQQAGSPIETIAGRFDKECDFVPHSKRPQGKCSNVRAVFNLLLSAIGCGLIALPKQFAETGYLGGTISMVIGVVLANSALMKLAYAIEHQDVYVQSYEHLATLLFGRIGKVFTGVVVHGTIGACAASLIIVITKSLMRLFNDNGVFSDYRLSAFLAALPLLPLAWLKNMHEASYVALVGTLAVFGLALTIVIAGFMEVSNRSASAAVDVSAFAGGAAPFLMAVSVCVFAFNTANTAPSLIHDMRTPKAFGKTVVGAASLIFAIYLAIALSGYLGWGANIRDYDTVINLVLGEKKDAAGNLVKKPLEPIGYVCAVMVLLLAYPHYVVLLVPVATAAESALGGIGGLRKYKGEMGFSRLVRSLTWGVTVGFAVVVQNFGDVVDIVAGIAMPFIALLLPICFYLKTKANRGEKLDNVDVGITGLIFAAGLGLLGNGLREAVVKLFL